MYTDTMTHPLRPFSALSILLLVLPLAAGAAGGPALKTGWRDLPEDSLTAHSAIVLDRKTGKVLYTKSPDLPWVAASLTKLMTSVIWMEQQPRMSGTVSLTDEDEVGGGRLRVATGTILTSKDLLYCALVGSANNTAMAMMRTSGLPRDAFVREMNIRAATLGMTQTTYVEPSGMDTGNVTSARDMATLATYAFGNPTIRRAAQTGSYNFLTVSPTIVKSVKSTNALLLDPANGLWITGGKTGYLEEARNNLVITVQTMRRDKELVVALLGADTKQHSFAETERLTKWAWENYVW